MSDILNPIISSKAFQGVSFVLGLVCFIFVALLLLWLFRDARRRGSASTVWTVIGVVAAIVAAFVGLSFVKYGFGPVGIFAVLVLLVLILIYTLVRPEDLLADAREQQLELALLEAQIERETCPTCGQGIEDKFLVCPHCNTTLRIPCDYCGQPIKPEWMVCPYCKASQRQHFDDTTSFLPSVEMATFSEDDLDETKPAKRKTTRTRGAR